MSGLDIRLPRQPSSWAPLAGEGVREDVWQLFLWVRALSARLQTWLRPQQRNGDGTNQCGRQERDALRCSTHPRWTLHGALLKAVSIVWSPMPRMPLASGDGTGLLTGGSLCEIWGFSLCLGHLGPKPLCVCCSNRPNK